MKRTDASFFLGKKELYQQLAETKLRIALLSQQERENKAMLTASAQSANSAQDKEANFFAATQSQTLKKIHTQIRKQSMQQLARRDLPKLGKAVAAILLVFYLGLTTAVATVSSVRVSLMKLLYHVEEQYTEISFQPDEDASFDVPAAWAGNYFMSYIPDGYTLMSCTSKLSFKQEIIYTSEEGKWLRFAEMALDAEININTEGFRISPVQINNASGLLAEKADEIAIIWAMTDRYFVLRLTGSAETAKMIAENVIRIK